MHGFCTHIVGQLSPIKVGLSPANHTAKVPPPSPHLSQAILTERCLSFAEVSAGTHPDQIHHFPNTAIQQTLLLQKALLGPRLKSREVDVILDSGSGAGVLDDLLDLHLCVQVGEIGGLTDQLWRHKSRKQC